MQLVPITTSVRCEFKYRQWRGVLHTTLCDNNLSVICGRLEVFSGYSGSGFLILKVALSTITVTLTTCKALFSPSFATTNQKLGQVLQYLFLIFYMAFIYFGFKRPWGRLFQKRVLFTKFEIYVYRQIRYFPFDVCLW